MKTASPPGGHGISVIGDPAPSRHAGAFRRARSSDRPGETVLRLPARADRAPGIRVTPDDFAGVPVRGSHLVPDAERIVIRREDAVLGAIHNHFPGAGFAVAADPWAGSAPNGPGSAHRG